MSLYKNLIVKDREIILTGVTLGLPYQKIATKVGCKDYFVIQAQGNYQHRRLNSRRPRLLENDDLRNFVVRKIMVSHWSPE
ncbi:transposase [Lactobacillus plantarum] [Lactiplantibacillus mudanjiangensis]|uniref:Transposase [Lactobacillus plantarum] n=1 Tax=Lactiplantibacillus mudanjiangensis TaxID=1296538 RepID=A0A660DYW0_9LACO|nr:hypothetical protein [Lactiplantibacillus mudanjiangensis]VDG24018.1 transposase [Lactobacillus plantarum] [Lactiplantibacillus mudanjiangensis]VDG27264.1 transposase [Lactobacillus plantarum] [Lactiplantibacillus mudanjiangensis]